MMDGLGITVLSTTSFPLAHDIVSDLNAGLARAAALGGRIANTRVLDANVGRRTGNFAALGAVARRHGLELTIEFTRYGCGNAMDEALTMIRQTGFGKRCLDPLHIVRTDTTIEMLRALAPEDIGYVQLCDGPMHATAEDYGSEGGYHRARVSFRSSIFFPLPQPACRSHSKCRRIGACWREKA